MPALRPLVLLALAACCAQAQLVRVPNSTLSLPPEPPRFGYRTEAAFGGLKFTDPVAIVSPPGDTNSLFVVEQRGRIAVITNLVSPNRTVFLDIASRVAGGVPADERGLLGLAFHPGYATNRTFFITYTATGTGGPFRLSRFQAMAGDPGRADPTETILLEQPDEAPNHNAGDIHFGADGYLYLSLGDEGGGNDNFANSQRITKDFFSAIARIDVDRRPTSIEPNPHPSIRLNADGTARYAVPADNPFVGATQFNGQAVDPARVRTEFWAVGLRNPWRFTFDPATGELYVADVGQDRREEIDLIVRGGNYGWNFLEGTLSGPRAAPAGFTSVAPIYEYNHGSGTNQGNSVTGGIVHRGPRLSQLQGAYVFADYVSGHVWALRHDGRRATSVVRVVTEPGIAAFGVDPGNGDILIANQSSDTIKRLMYSASPTGAEIPSRLSGTGAFSDLAALQPHAGIVQYELNVPFWSDGAIKSRWFSLPDRGSTFGFRPTGNWLLPTGAVWIKHFELELTPGVPSSRRRLETRFLVRNSQGVYGVSYRWDPEGKDATLLGEDGMDEAIEVQRGGVTRTQVWHYPSRGECLICHTAVGGMALGFNTAQLNRDVRHGETFGNQLGLLARAGYLDRLETPVQTLPALAHPTNESVSLVWRARSYLDANCSHCHQPGGPALGLWDARAEISLIRANIVDGLLRVEQDQPDLRVVAPGDPSRSAILRHMTVRGPGQMPPLATSEPDQDGIGLLNRWIKNHTAGYQTFAAWQESIFGDPGDPRAAPESDPDGDGAVNELEFLVGSDPARADLVLRLEGRLASGGVELAARLPAGLNGIIEWSRNAADPASWMALDDPANQFAFQAAPREIRVLDAGDRTGARFYRLKIYGP